MFDNRCLTPGYVNVAEESAQCKTARLGDVWGLGFDPHDRDGWQNSQHAETQQVTMSRRVRVQSEAAATEAAVAASDDRARFGGRVHPVEEHAVQ